MPYDVAFRHQQALDPSALVTIGASLHAITRAIDDCRNAGIAFETDPAVILLARHLASVTARQSEDALLKRRCMDRIAELRQHPALLTLAVRGVAHDAAAKDRFHSDGRKALRRLAAALGVEATDGVDWLRWIISIIVAAVLVVAASTITGRNNRAVR